MTPRRNVLLPCLAAVLAAVATASAQPGSLPRPPVLPGGPGPQVAPAPVPLDTLTADVALPPAVGGLRSFTIRPDSVLFGAVAWLVAEGQGTAVPDSLPLPAWLAPAPGAGPVPGVPAPPAGATVLPVRVYGVQPFRLRAGGLATNVVTVLSRGTDGAVTAPVRDPRQPGWNGLVLAGILAAVALLAALLARLLRRRRGPSLRPEDRPVPGPAWPRLALELEGMLAELSAGGAARPFLDRLAGLVRGYAADRFGIAGREMTGAEIAAACRRLGYPAAAGRAFAVLLDALDARRFDPEPVGEGWCRDRAADLVSAVAAVRIVPRATPGAVATDAEAAWRRLVGARSASGGEAA